MHSRNPDLNYLPKSSDLSNAYDRCACTLLALRLQPVAMQAMRRPRSTPVAFLAS